MSFGKIIPRWVQSYVTTVTLHYYHLNLKFQKRSSLRNWLEEKHFILLAPDTMLQYFISTLSRILFKCRIWTQLTVVVVFNLTFFKYFVCPPDLWVLFIYYLVCGPLVSMSVSNLRRCSVCFMLDSEGSSVGGANKYLLICILRRKLILKKLQMLSFFSECM